MAALKKEYIDIKDVKHRVEHLTFPEKDNGSKEQIIEELLHALTKPSRHLSS